ncbi:hypothetical protein EVAR_27862_1 [Eumeta japonica]|uniref:Uncharacterized protein n=1 Tax=Eumeta variegata TaxID=151549 RepID=A0A4C1VLD0_EUMVA|nr:hypothetical protein EVAR_27862_1 [Eumeta japonica]
MDPQVDTFSHERIALPACAPQENLGNDYRRNSCVIIAPARAALRTDNVANCGAVNERDWKNLKFYRREIDAFASAATLYRPSRSGCARARSSGAPPAPTHLLRR